MAIVRTMKRPQGVASLLLGAALLVFQGASFAQPKPKPAAPLAPKAGQKPGTPVDLDAEEPTKKAAASSTPPVAGQPTDAASHAKRLYEAEKWWEASEALYRVYTGETGDDEGNRQIAQFNLAKAYYKLKFYQAAYAIFSEIADKSNHLKFNETLLWLAKLATDLPEPADIVERVGKYSDAQISRFDNAEQRELFWQLNYLLGRYKYRNNQFAEAIGLFKKVNRQSKYYVQAQFFTGISHVQLRQSVPAVQSFQRILGAIDEGVEGVEDEARMRDLAYLSMARTFYSASVKLDDATNQPTIDPQRLDKAVYFWNKVDVASEYWLVALFEESWAYYMAGDFAHALGNIHTIQAPYFPNSYYPEAEILRAVIYFANCQYDDAEILAKQFRAKFEPIRDELTKEVEKVKKAPNLEEGYYKLLKSVREGKAKLDPRIQPVVELALSDRQTLRNLEYVKMLDDEAKRYNASPHRFRESKAGDNVKDTIHDARLAAVRAAGELAKERYQRNIDELNEHIRDAQKLLIDVTSAKRGILTEKLKGGQVTEKEGQVNIVTADEEHVLWPFRNDEYWRDELGYYRQTIVPKCGR